MHIYIDVGYYKCKLVYRPTRGPKECFTTHHAQQKLIVIGHIGSRPIGNGMITERHKTCNRKLKVQGCWKNRIHQYL